MASLSKQSPTLQSDQFHGDHTSLEHPLPSYGADIEEQRSLAISHSDPWWKTTLTGYSTGFITVITGHPFDTLKTRLQTGATKDLFRHLWRGIVPPLLTTPPSWSINFMLYQSSLKIFGTDTVSNSAFAGGVAGVIWSTCMTPPELIVCSLCFCIFQFTFRSRCDLLL